MMNKGQTELRGVLVGVLILGMAILGFTSLYAGMASAYNATPETINQFQSIQEANATAQGIAPIMANASYDSGSALGAAGTPYIILTQGIGLGLYLLSLPGLTIKLVADFVTLFAIMGIPIPTWFIAYTGIILSVVLVLAVVYFLIGRKP